VYANAEIADAVCSGEVVVISRLVENSMSPPAVRGEPWVIPVVEFVTGANPSPGTYVDALVALMVTVSVV
jgi:hypothetical protein